MIQIFTSSFKRARRLDSSEFFVVSISRFPPKWFKGYCCFDFAPSVQLLHDYHEGLSDFDYSRRYRRQVLDRVDVHKVFEGLAVLAGGRDIVLCCFEDAFQFCHRRLLARFVQERFHYSIEEYI